MEVRVVGHVEGCAGGAAGPASPAAEGGQRVEEGGGGGLVVDAGSSAAGRRVQRGLGPVHHVAHQVVQDQAASSKVLFQKILKNH